MRKAAVSRSLSYFHFMAEQRIIEAQRLGFHAAVIPMKNYRQLKGKFAGMELFGAETIGDALKCAMPKNI